MKSQASKTVSGNIKLVTTGLVEIKVGDPPTFRCKGVALVIVEHCIIFLYGNQFEGCSNYIGMVLKQLAGFRRNLCIQRITSQTSDYTNVYVFRNI